MKKLGLIVFLFFIFSSNSFLFSASEKAPSWITGIDKKIRYLDSKFDGEFGVFVQDLKSQESYSFKGDKVWYLSSTVKVPVAIALFQMVDRKEVKLSETVEVQRKDFRDGAGPVNWLKPGSRVSYKYLLDQMLIYSDNAATDLIIKRVGLDKVNKVVADFAIAKEFGPITTLLGVRKKAYSEIHPEAERLSNRAFFAIKKARTPSRRINQLAIELKVEKKDLKTQDLTEGFFRYYSKGWNSATLQSYALLLRNLLENKILSEKSTQLLIKTMTGIQTGKKRVWRGLKEGIVWAHKTGTQHKQACDIGFAHQKQRPADRVLILVCTSNWKNLSQAEKLMTQVGQILSQTPLFPESPVKK